MSHVRWDPPPGGRTRFPHYRPPSNRGMFTYYRSYSVELSNPHYQGLTLPGNQTPLQILPRSNATTWGKCQAQLYQSVLHGGSACESLMHAHWKNRDDVEKLSNYKFLAGFTLSLKIQVYEIMHYLNISQKCPCLMSIILDKRHMHCGVIHKYIFNSIGYYLFCNNILGYIRIHG